MEEIIEEAIVVIDEEPIAVGVSNETPTEEEVAPVEETTTPEVMQ